MNNARSTQPRRLIIARISPALLCAALIVAACSTTNVVVIVGEDHRTHVADGAVVPLSTTPVLVGDPPLIDSGGSGVPPSAIVDVGVPSSATASVPDAASSDASGDAHDATIDVGLTDSSAVSTASSSCAGGLACGGASCCDAKTVPGGMFMQGRATAGPENDVCLLWKKWYPDCDSTLEQPELQSTVSTFTMDTFEVTVGRFRKFLEAYPGSQPAAGAGAHPKIAGSGWDASWTDNLPVDRAALIASVACDPFYATWTDAPAANENKPINCLDWYTAFAFCAWDGGRLPTEAEWEYAASGGEDRVAPWEVPPMETEPDISHAIFGCLYNPSAGLCTGVTNIADVGTVPLGASRWGQLDMAGNVWEWTLDVLARYDTSARVDYASLAPGAYRVQRGGSYSYRAGGIRAAERGYNVPWFTTPIVGVRCARRT
jgi:formylglycine-generating enzyme required for sulfatase activity